MALGFSGGSGRVTLALPASSEAQVLLTDEITDALATISTVHHEVHEGETFRAWYISPHGSLVADNGFVDLVLITGSKHAHVVFALGFGGDCEFNIYRGPDFDLDGTTQTPHNLKDYSIGTSTVAARWGPTINNVGTEIHGEFVGGGTTGRSAGGAIRDNTEDILRPNTSYLVRVTNRAGNAQQFSLVAQWYEETVG